MSFRGALITGAGRRVGRAIALELARRGYDIAVHCHKSLADAVSTAETARKFSVKAEVLQANLLDEEDLTSLVERSCEALGTGLSVLVNNASIFSGNTIVTATGDDWNRHIGTNLHAPFVLTQDFARQSTLADTDQAGERVATGNVINMVDQRVLRPTAMFSTYTVAKMGLWDLTRTAAISLAPDIRVNAIGPGPTIPTPDQSDEHFARQRSNTLLQRGTNLDDIVMTLGLILDCPSITGQLFCVDGGQHLGKSGDAGR